MAMETQAIGELIISLAMPLLGGLVALVLVAAIGAAVEVIDKKQQDSQGNQEGTR